MLPCILALLHFFCASIPIYAQIDPQIDQTVWKMLYGVTDAQISDPAWLAGDDDGDGTSNGSELVAGTNPFTTNSTFRITSALASADSPSITFPSITGKLYALQFSTDLTDASSWSAFSPPMQTMGNGSLLTFVPPSPDLDRNTFYRINVQNVDSDADGVSDWAETITGFDASADHTHGALENDHAALLHDFMQENVVTVRATKSTATQPVDSTTLATDTASITITRGGTLHFSAITVPITVTGTAVAGVDFASLPSFVTFPARVGSITLTITPLANSSQQTSSTVTISAMSGGGYTLGGTSSASVVIAPSGKPAGSGLTGMYFNGTSTGAKAVSPYNPALFTGTPALTRVDPTLDYVWSSTASPSPGVVNPTYFGVRWQGQVQPQYSETYTFDVVSDDGVKLWVNGQLILDSWSYIGADRLANIPLQAGVLYDIRLEYYQAAGGDQIHLYWYSNSQPKQVIPASRLYPLATTAAPPAITSPATAVGFVNQAFTFNVTASVSGGLLATFARGIGSGPFPPGLTLNPTTGQISGIPTAAGNFQVTLTATTANGVGASVLDIQILNLGSGVTRELWPGLPGASISDIPPALSSPPQPPDNALVALEDSAAYGNNTGERLRGYFVAPATGNYYFWIAASNNAELWISNDAEPVNLVRRAWITAPGTTSQNWADATQPHQKSPWIALTAGQSYYYEVLHNTGGSGDSSHVSVSYLLDPLGATANPPAGATPAPGYLLSKYGYPTTVGAEGDLYVTNLSPQGSAATTATGSANLRMMPGNAQAILHFNYSGLSSPRTAYHIHIASDHSSSGQIVFDLDDMDKFHPELITEDGGYIWNITDSGIYTAAQIVSAIQQGLAYLNVHTVNYPSGEIRGFLSLVKGSQKAPVPVPDPSFTDDHSTDAGAARFLNQAAFGAAPSDMAIVKSGGYDGWISNQLTLPATHLLPDVQAQAARIASNPYASTTVDNAWWRAAVFAPDQLRQRMAFALSQILVVSDTSQTLAIHADGLASYYDTLADNAFGNFRDLLKAVTLHPTMGFWLNMQGNAPGNLATGYHPNENYAREIMQLFSIGLNRLWPDGSLVLDSQGNLVPTYDQGVITNGFARVFTGWNWNQALQTNGQLPNSFSPPSNFTAPMVMVKKYHELGTKTLLDNVVLPAASGYNPTGAPVAGSQADPSTALYDSYGTQDLESTLDSIFYHPNTGPYICRQLIQRLVASHPSPAYLQRVVQVFNDDASPSHTRGNLAAVVRAILLDGEARDAALAQASNTWGKQREPLLRITGPARTFPFVANSGTYSESGTSVVTVTTNQPHRLSGGDAVGLDFSANTTGNPPVAPTSNPSSGSYTVLSTPAPTANTFAVTASGLSNVGYSQAANSNTLTINTSGPPVGEKVYLKFISGSSVPEGIYLVASVPDASHFTITTDAAPTAAVSGTVIMPKATGYYTVTNSTGSTLTVTTSYNSNVNVGDHFQLQTSLTKLADAEFVVSGIIDERKFTVSNSTVYEAETNQPCTIYPLAPPPLVRSGNVSLGASKFDMGNTNALIGQTPLNAPTVFNYFYPDYQYPGSLSANHVTTPEFQLTTDTNIVNLTNTISSTILSSANTNGLSSFKSGSINLDLGSYMTAPYVSVSTTSTTSGTKVTSTTTTTVDATALVNKLGDILTGGMLTQSSKDVIIAFLNNTTSFPPTTTATGTTTSPPSAPSLPTTSARDKVRTAVQLILVSPEYAIQK